MELTVHTPDDIASRMACFGDISRRALEALALDKYRNGHITDLELRRLLGFATRYQLDGFLKTHGFTDDLTLGDLDQDLSDLKSAGF